MPAMFSRWDALCAGLVFVVALWVNLSAVPTTEFHRDEARWVHRARFLGELRRLGQAVEEFPDGLRITPQPLRPAALETYDDHRMAMSFAVAALRAPGIRLRDPGCVAKTFPTFFDLLDAVTP